ncbi:MAG: hypothetical protein OXF88_14040 [Rhodobacteraceae bacterium]|nr:hypothetical protein [Paracoccaceae bacterium]MCY4138735.1 hypothetical protein [Paracoccaceae bacterium]
MNRQAEFDLSGPRRDVKGNAVCVSDRFENASRKGRFVAPDLGDDAQLEGGASVAGTTAADRRTGAARTMVAFVARATEVRHDDCRSKEAGQGGIGGNPDWDS